MTGVIVDASALLTFLLAEEGSDAVAGRLRHAAMSAVNYTETLTRSLDRGKQLGAAAADIARLQLSVVPFDAEQATVAASLRAATRHLGLSLGDRACLALAISRRLPVLTADRAWAGLHLQVEIQVIR